MVVWDTETTGFYTKDHPIYVTNISFQLLDGDPTCSDDLFTAFVSLPDEVEIPQAVLKRVPITKQILLEKKATPFKDVAKKFQQFLSKYESVLLVAHCSSILDEPVLRAEFQRNNMEIPSNWRFMDSKPLLKQWNSDFHKGQYSMEILYSLLCDPKGFVGHLAQQDTIALAKIIKATTKKRFDNTNAAKYVRHWYAALNGLDQHKITEYQTPTIDTTPSTMSTTQITTASDSKKAFGCQHCNKRFTTQGWLARHIKTVHDDGGQNSNKRKAEESPDRPAKAPRLEVQ